MIEVNPDDVEDNIDFMAAIDEFIEPWKEAFPPSKVGGLFIVYGTRMLYLCMMEREEFESHVSTLMNFGKEMALNMEGEDGHR